MLRPVDILVALKLAAFEEPVSIRGLAESLGLKKSAVGNVLSRRADAQLLVGERDDRRPSQLALHEFLAHATRYLFPAEPREWTRGLPTAHSAQSLAQDLLSDKDTVVMPLDEGPVRGRRLDPIHPAAPTAALSDPRLHELLALVDALRIGDARERSVAGKRLKECLAVAQPS